MFLGSHKHIIDSKGRLILPVNFRARLADGAVITPLDSCLGILPLAEFERMARKIEADVSEGKVGLDALRSLAGKADQQVPDAQGRIRVLPRLREAAGLERNVMVTGAFTRVELWDIERWEEVQSSGTEKLAVAIAHGRGIGDA